MSVFGGDSWAREAHHRKRRVDDLIWDTCQNSAASSSYKRLSNGKYACLVCPNNPVLDSPLMMSRHSQGSRHAAAAARLNERELLRQEEIAKRIALSDDSSYSTLSDSRSYFEKPLIERTKRAILGNVRHKCHGEACSIEKSSCIVTNSFPPSKVNEELHISSGNEYRGGTADCDKPRLQQIESLKSIKKKKSSS